MSTTNTTPSAALRALGEVYVDSAGVAWLVLHPRSPLPEGVAVLRNTRTLRGDPGYTLPQTVGRVAINLRQSGAVWAEGPDARWVVPFPRDGGATQWLDPKSGQFIRRIVKEGVITLQGDWDPSQSLWLDEHARALPASVEREGAPTQLELETSLWAAPMWTRHAAAKAAGKFWGRPDPAPGLIESAEAQAARGDKQCCMEYRRRAEEALAAL